MKKGRILKFFIVSILVMISSAFIMQYVNGAKNVDIKKSTILSDTSLDVDIGLPVSISIPSLSINTNIEHVGITKGGAMDAPEGPINVGWFYMGPRPGTVGSSVIDGHSGWKDGIKAVFDNLYKIKIGDKIYVKNSNGLTTVFIVRKLKTYEEGQDSTSVFKTSDGKAHLNLITCNGIWDSINKSHSSRLVVFADKVDN